MSETLAGILIFAYCAFQIIGCFAIGYAIYKMVKTSKAELAVKQEVRYDRRRAR